VSIALGVLVALPFIAALEKARKADGVQQSATTIKQNNKMKEIGNTGLFVNPKNVFTAEVKLKDGKTFIMIKPIGFRKDDVPTFYEVPAEADQQLTIAKAKNIIMSIPTE